MLRFQINIVQYNPCEKKLFVRPRSRSPEGNTSKKNNGIIEYEKIVKVPSQNLKKHAGTLENDERNSSNLSEFGHVSYFEWNSTKKSSNLSVTEFFFCLEIHPF